MFYLVVSDKMIDVPAEITDANGNKVDPPLPFENAKVLFTSEDIETIQGYITIAQDNPEHDIYKNVFLMVCTEDGVMHELYMCYEWLPHNMICRVEPPVEDIVNFVPTRPKIVNPACLKAINTFNAAQEKEAAKEARIAAKAAKAINPRPEASEGTVVKAAKKRGRPKKVKEVVASDDVAAEE